MTYFATKALAKRLEQTAEYGVYNKIDSIY